MAVAAVDWKVGKMGIWMATMDSRKAASPAALTVASSDEYKAV